jgi:hypothetical protein
VSNLRRPANRKAAVELARRQGQNEGARTVHTEAVVAAVRGVYVRDGAPGRLDDLPGGGVVLALPPDLRDLLKERMKAVVDWMGATQGAIDRVKVGAKDLREFHANEREAVADLFALLQGLMNASNKQGRVR